MIRRVVFRGTAEADLDSIYEFIAKQSPINAVNFTRRIRTYCDGLSLFPERGTRRDDLRPGLRLVGFERRVAIAFRVTMDEVEIARIFYGGRDFERLLKNE